MEDDSNFPGICKFIDLKLKEAKMIAAKSISTIISQIAAYLIITVLVIVTVCFLVIVEMQCLNECLGQPFGTLIATGTLVLFIVILFLLRKHLFTGILSKGIAGAMDNTLATAAFAISVLKKICK